MDRSRRRVVFGALASVGFAGCLGSDSVTDPGGSTPSDGENTSPTATPEVSPTATQTEPTPTADEETTPEGESTPTPAEGESTPAEDGDDSAVFPGYEMTTVTVRTPEGDRLGSVRAAIAETSSLRYTGLSDTDSLPESYGMLFVFDGVGERTFVMREMDFGIDIVYADETGEITTIHHAPEPGPDEDGEQQRYPGRGQYVLEVNRDWTTDRGVEEGDVLDFEL